MQVAIVTVGDELLAGDTENTNATWLGRQVTERGARVQRVLTVPDDHEAIVDAVRRYRERFDAVVVTGGLGGTHDDVTMAAVADAVGRDVVVDEAARQAVIERVAAYRDENPEVAEYEMELDPDAWAQRPAGARAVPNDAGLAPGVVVEAEDADGDALGGDGESAGELGAVYVLPGPPDELRAVFERMAEEFGGDLVSETLYTPMPESALTGPVEAARDEFPVVVGSYPARGDDHNRVKVSADDQEAVAAATEWLRERLDVVDPE